jgi:hypothetical protein
VEHMISEHKITAYDADVLNNYGALGTTVIAQ